MWVLSADGDILKGKQLWLRPGSSHLLGRTSSKPQTGERVQYIHHDTVSRKHLFLVVSSVKPGDSGRAYAKCTVTATDASRLGTRINGEKIVKKSITLDGSKKEYLIKLASFDDTFKLQWKSVVFTSAVLKFQKNRGIEKEILERADVKLVTEYLSNETTHVVAKKRNTIEALQALVQGKWVVSENFLLALADACKKRDGDDETSPLEDDFGQHWPNEMDYVTPTATEPVSRPNELLRPDPERSELFKDQIFVFLSEAQHDKLLPIVTGGGGKALVCEFRAGQSTADDVVQFARETAGKKNSRDFMLSQELGPGGIVLVRPNERDEGRSDEILSHIQRELNRRMIEQNELLDAVLMKDTSSFRQVLLDSTQAPVDEEMEDAPPASMRPPGLSSVASSGFPRPPNHRSDDNPLDAPPPENQRVQRPGSTEQNDNHSTEQPEEQPVEQASTRRRRRIITTQSRAKFGEDFDPTQIIRPKSESPAPSQAPSMQAMDVDDGPAQVPDMQRGKGKRPAPPESENEVGEETADQRYDRLHPAQAALKRRKLEAAKREDRSLSENTPEPSGAGKIIKEEPKSKSGKKRAVDTDAELKAKIKAQREAEEERRRLDDEVKEEALDPLALNIDPDKLVERFEVLALPQTRQNGSETREGHPEWNGRQNFKRFRSNKTHNRDYPRQRNPESQRVIISLEEIPNKGHGLGDENWLETGHDQRRKSKNKSQSQSRPSASQASAAPRQAAPASGEKNVPDEEEVDSHAFRRRLQRSRDEDDITAEGYDALDVPVHGAGDLPPRSTAGSSQTLRGDVSQVVGTKRAANSVGAGPPAKKARGMVQPRIVRTSVRKTQVSQTRTIENESEEEDPTAFRRRKR